MATPLPTRELAAAGVSPEDRIATVFKAVADPTRLRILNLLRGPDGTGSEVCVCDLTRVIDAPQATVSRHLAYLRRTNLVETRRDGNWIHYRLSDADGAFHQKVLECLKCCLDEVPQLRADRAALRGTACC